MPFSILKGEIQHQKDSQCGGDRFTPLTTSLERLLGLGSLTVIGRTPWSRDDEPGVHGTGIVFRETHEPLEIYRQKFVPIFLETICVCHQILKEVCRPPHQRTRAVRLGWLLTVSIQ